MTATATLEQEKKFFTNLDLLVLVYDSAVGTKFKLKPTTINVLHGLSRHYNPRTGLTFPSCSAIAKKINSTRETVTNAIKELKENGLILVEKDKKHNIYKFTDKFFNALECKKKPCRKSKNSTLNIVESRKSSHKHNNNHEQNKGTSSCAAGENSVQDDDDDFKNNFSVDLETEKLNPESFNTLKTWGFNGIQQAISKYGTQAIEDCIKEVENADKKKSIKVKGAYLRTILASYTNKKQAEVDKYQERVKRLQNDAMSHLNNVELAKVQIFNYSVHQVRYLSDNDITHIAEAVTRWGFDGQEFVFLKYLFAEMGSNDILKRKYSEAVKKFQGLK